MNQQYKQINDVETNETAIMIDNIRQENSQAQYTTAHSLRKKQQQNNHSCIPVTGLVSCEILFIVSNSFSGVAMHK